MEASHRGQSKGTGSLGGQRIAKRSTRSGLLSADIALNYWARDHRSGLAIVLIAITIFLCLAYGDRIERLLGPAGTDIAVRLSAFILFCLGVQILWSGGSELLKSVIQPG